MHVEVPRETFGHLVRNLASVHAMRPRDIARVINRSESYVSMLTNDKIGTPPPEVVHALSQAFGVPEHVFLVKMGYLQDEPEVNGGIPIDSASDALIELIARLSPSQREAVTSLVREFVKLPSGLA